MDFCIPVSGLSYPVANSFCYHSLYIGTITLRKRELIRGTMFISLSGLVVRATIWGQLPIPWRLLLHNLDNDLHGFWI